MSVLEYLLSPPPPVADNSLALDRDIQGMVAEVTTCLQDLHETIEIWNGINLHQIQSDFPDNVILLTENREEYLQKRKSLISLIRNVTTNALSEGTSLTIPEIQQQCRIMIDQFKSDFDNLSTMCKRTEGLYLELYKTLREVPDPIVALSNSSKTNHRVLTALQENEILLKKFHHEFVLKDNQIKELLQQQEHLRQELAIAGNPSSSSQEILQAEFIEMKSQLEKEFQRHEEVLRHSFEKKFSEVISNSERALREKDDEIEQLNDLLTSLRHSVSQLQEEHALYLFESEKRQEVEMKFQILTRKFSEISETKESIQSEMSVLENKYNILEKHSNEMKQRSHEQVRDCEADLRRVTEEKKDLEELLRRYPPIDFETLLNQLGLNYDEDLLPGKPLSHENQEKDSSSRRSQSQSSWSHGQIKLYLQSVIRKYQHVISELQTENMSLTTQFHQCEEENQTMKEQIDSNHETILKLERDLSDAYSSIEVSKALLKCHSMMSGPNHRQQSHEATLFNESEMGGGGEGIVELGSGPEASGTGTNNTILKGILNQRDRMMKLAREKENEVNSLQNQLKSHDSTLSQLRQDNLRLYQRIRSLRLTHPPPPGSVGSVNTNSCSERFDEEEGGGGVTLIGDAEETESKYRSLYEGNLDLSQLLFEHDRQVLFAQLHEGERYLMAFLRFILQDSFRRHCYLVYMTVVHLILLYYLLLLLTPVIDSDLLTDTPLSAVVDRSSGDFVT
jgi:hypothetical protein